MKIITNKPRQIFAWLERGISRTVWPQLLHRPECPNSAFGIVHHSLQTGQRAWISFIKSYSCPGVGDSLMQPSVCGNLILDFKFLHFEIRGPVLLGFDYDLVINRLWHPIVINANSGVGYDRDCGLRH